MSRWGRRAAVVLSFSFALISRAEAAGIIYAATSNGVFKTSNGGATWTPANAGLAGINVFSLAVDPATPATVYAGTFGNRVFKTTDGGEHWLPARAGFEDDTALVLAIDPRHPATIYAGTTASSSASASSAFFPGRGVIKSGTGAAGWIAASAGLPRSIVTALAIDPSNPGVLYAGTSAAGVFRSTNAGLTWTAANAGISASDISHLVVDPGNPRVIYAGLEGCSAGCASPAGVFKSLDGGTSWASANVGLADDLQVVALAIDPFNTRVLYAATRFNGIFKTTDAGGRWVSVNPAPTGTMFAIVHFALVTDPANAGTVYAGTFDGILKTSDGGKTWVTANSGLPPSTRVFALAVGSI